MKTNMITTVERIGPKTAQKYLENQSRNRALNKRTVDKYAAAMSADAWELTHQGIAFDKDGKLFDGQHRMAAVVQSGKTIEFSVSRYANTDNASKADHMSEDDVRRIVREEIRVAMNVIGDAFGNSASYIHAHPDD